MQKAWRKLIIFMSDQDWVAHWSRIGTIIDYGLVEKKLSCSRLPNTSSAFSEKRLSALVSFHVHGHGQDVWRREDWNRSVVHIDSFMAPHWKINCHDVSQCANQFLKVFIPLLLSFNLPQQNPAWVAFLQQGECENGCELLLTDQIALV